MVYNYLKNGEESVQLGTVNTFGRIVVDQAIEEAANKTTQTTGARQFKSWSSKQILPNDRVQKYLFAKFEGNGL